MVAAFTLQCRSDKKYWLILKAILFLMLGFILPFLAASAYFWLIGHFNDYIYANFTANKIRTVYLGFSLPSLIQDVFNQIQTNLFFWLSVLATTIYLFLAKAKPKQEKWIAISFIIWFFTILLGIFAVFRGPLYPHYFLQLSPPLCFITAYLLSNLVFSEVRRTDKIKFKKYLILSAILMVLLATPDTLSALESNAKRVYFNHVRGMKHWEDAPAQIADYLEPRLKSDDYIYMVDDAPIVYFLADTKIPTRYAFPPFLLLRTDLPNITGVAPLEELDRILQKQPVYIVRRKIAENPNYVSENQLFLSKLDQALSQSYEIETSIKGLDLYRIKR
jgi:hypothetical protein